MKATHEDHSMFHGRVADARLRLASGETPEEIKSLHGGIVLKQAIYEQNSKSRKEK
jgi:hypothetical protein